MSTLAGSSLANVRNRTRVIHNSRARNIHKKIQQINAEYTSKVTSLQALLCKAFRSPGVLVLGDFGFSA